MGSNDAANEQVVVFGHWMPHSEKAKELLDAFGPVLQYARQNDEAILCFYLLKEKKDDGGAAIVTASCFKSKKSYDEYLGSTARSTLDRLCAKQNLLREPQREQHLKTAAGFPWRSTRINPGSGNHVAMAKIDYASGRREEGIEHWKQVAASVEENEKDGTYTYWFLADPENENVLYSLERYRDEPYLWDVHVPSAAIQENIGKQKHIRTGLVLRGFESVEQEYGIET